jgi:hypothetical protein
MAFCSRKKSMKAWLVRDRMLGVPFSVVFVGHRKNKRPFSQEPNVSEESLAVNLTGNHPNLAKFVFDPQQKVLI